jgi:hypothetical protein
LSMMVLFRSHESSRASSRRWSCASDISTIPLWMRIYCDESEGRAHWPIVYHV